jgi:hypothetical protein
VKKTSGLLILLPLLMTRTALADLNEGLVGYWTFDGNANDFSGNNNHGLLNAPTLTQDRFGNLQNAYHFDGNDFIRISNNSSFNTQDITLSAWFLYDELIGQTQWRIVNKQEPNINSSWGIQIFGPEYGNSLGTQLDFHVGNGTIYVNCLSTTDLEINRWYHVAATHVASTNEMKVYVDGVLEKTCLSEGLVPIIESDVVIGKLLDNHFLWKGKIDEVRIYNRPLSKREVLQLLNGETPPPPVLTITPEEFEAAKNEAYEAGRQACVTDPLSCGISNVPGGAVTFSFADNILRIPAIEVSAPLIGTQVYQSDMLLVPSEAPFGFHFELQTLEQTQ